MLTQHVQRLLNSYRHWTGTELIVRSGNADEQARALDEASVFVVSHGTQPDPILNYGNRAAFAQRTIFRSPFSISHFQLLLSVLICVHLWFPLRSAAEEPWNGWRGPHRDGVSPLALEIPTAWPKKLTEVWSARAKAGFSSPV